MTRLLHHSIEPLQAVFSAQQGTPSWKPNGLWVSVEGSDDWWHWCQAERFRLHTLRSTVEVVLKADAKIRRIKTEADLRRFHKAYNTGSAFADIDWRKVAKKYQGIIIAPYQWKCRHGLGWYYTWDVASGCVWDADAIERLDPVDPATLGQACKRPGWDCHLHT